ncbi:MAG TPA: hypothetical protein VNX46_06155 [Candidatus Acidoferrum sp.]|nr:hypothetical protein [Candidatus Acidoferrum sp.]
MKKLNMKNLIMASLLVGGATMLSQSGFAQTLVANDLYFGFENQAGGGTEDYIINLGPAANIVGGSTVVDLSSLFSLSDFNAVLSGSSSMFGGVVGGLQSSGTADIYLTQLRSSGVGIPSVPGSSITSTISRTTINNAISALNPANMPAAGSGILDTTKSWEAYVEPTLGNTSFYGASGFNPDSAAGLSPVLYEDLWYSVNGTLSSHSSFIYQGYFTLDLTGSNPVLTFTPKNASAPLTAPVIISVSKTGTTITVVANNASPTHTYQLQYTTSLINPSWSNVGSPQVASATTVTNTDTTATDLHRFYRVMGQ